MEAEQKTPAWAYWILGLITVMVIGLGAMSTPPNVQPVAAVTDPPASSSRVMVSESPAASAPPAPTNWTYRMEPDPMGSGSTSYATTKSRNTVEFSFPYQGAQHGRLIIRSGQAKGRDVMLFIDRGQFLVNSYRGTSVLLRFDEEPAFRVSVAGAGDHSTTTLFLSGFQGLVTRMKKAKTLRIQAPVYQEGEPVFEFNVAGLVWPPPKES